MMMMWRVINNSSSSGGGGCNLDNSLIHPVENFLDDFRIFRMMLLKSNCDDSEQEE